MEHTKKPEVDMDKVVHPHALCSSEDKFALYYTDDSDRNICKVVLQLTGVGVKGTVSHVVDPHDGIRKTSALSVHGSKCYYSAIQGNRPGIYMFDIETEAHTSLHEEDVGIQGLDVLYDERVVFTSTSKHKVLSICDDHSVKTLAGSGIYGARDDSNKTSQLRTPYGICVEQRTIYITDPTSKRVITITPADASAAFSESLAQIYSGCGIHEKHTKTEDIQLSDTLEKMKSHHKFTTEQVQNAIKAQNITKKATNGPEGTISSKTQKSVLLLKNGIETLLATVGNYKVDVCSLLTSNVENLHALSHMKHETFSYLE
jgi:hypothetical protein